MMILHVAESTGRQLHPLPIDRFDDAHVVASEAVRELKTDVELVREEDGWYIYQPWEEVS